MKLNAGCGLTPIEGWVNLDIAELPGVDIVADLTKPLPFDDDTFDEILLSHVLEHMENPLDVMAELHRVAKPDCTMIIRVPHGAHDNAWEDQTHVRPYFPGSFGAFAQQYYRKADYGYRGDWRTVQVILVLDEASSVFGTVDEATTAISRERNWVTEMVAELSAVKPIRDPHAPLDNIDLHYHRPVLCNTAVDESFTG